MKKYARILVVFFYIGGCSDMPVVNIEHAPIRINKSNYTIVDVERAILTAGNRMGWVMYKTKPGKIDASYQTGSHFVEVIITYNMTEYNIFYKDSENMNYSSGEIHNNYNKWVGMLNRQIQLDLGSYL